MAVEKKHVNEIETTSNLSTRIEDGKIDKLIRKFPGRIVVVSEGTNSSEESVANTNLDQYFYALMELQDDKDFKKSLENYKKFIVGHANGIINRDTENAKVIDEVVHNSHPDRVFIKFGTLHTMLGHALLRAGHKVTRNFPEKKNQTLV
ncbi:MAG: hypothetical protein AAB907_00090, partial [Patescibacteria group bacterium]